MNGRGFLYGLVIAIMLPMLNYQVADAQKVRIAPCVRSNPSYTLPFYAAEEKNLWSKNGIEGEWVPMRAGAAMARAMAAGALDAGICAPLGAIRAIARGVPEVIVADLQSPQDWGIFVLANSRIKGKAALKGTKIGISRMGGSAHAYGIAVAKALGMEKDIKWVAAGGAREEIAALKAGAHDGIIFSYYGMGMLMFKGEVRDVLRIHDYLPKEWMDLGLFARIEFADKSPDSLKKTLKGLFEANGFVMDNADWTVEKLKKEYKYSEGLARRIHKDVLRYGREPKLNLKAVANVRAFMIDAGILAKDKAPPLNKLATTEFVK
jgi:ABC-type nitrate/sulfonate/bicarbonate transport system substrate-binding protein